MSDFLLNLVRRSAGIELDVPAVQPEAMPEAAASTSIDNSLEAFDSIHSNGLDHGLPRDSLAGPTDATSFSNPPRRSADTPANLPTNAAHRSDSVPLSQPSATVLPGPADMIQRAPVDMPGTTFVAPRPTVTFPVAGDTRPSAAPSPAVTAPSSVTPIAERASDSNRPLDSPNVPSTATASFQSEETSSTIHSQSEVASAPANDVPDSKESQAVNDVAPATTNPRDGFQRPYLETPNVGESEPPELLVQVDAAGSQPGQETAGTNQQPARQDEGLIAVGETDSQRQPVVTPAQPTFVSTDGPVRTDVAAPSATSEPEPELPLPLAAPPQDSLMEPDTTVHAFGELPARIESDQPQESVAAPAPTVVSPRPPTKHVLPDQPLATGDQQPASSIQVRIGSVEIRATKPVAETPPAAPRRSAEPLGFESFRKLRGYSIHSDL